jgi:hypothetical protein
LTYLAPPVRERCLDFAIFLSEDTDAEMIARLRSAETSAGRSAAAIPRHARKEDTAYS